MAKTCTNCNKIYDDKMMYCPECGRNLVSVPTKEETVQSSSESSSAKKGSLMEWALLAGSILALWWSWEFSALYGMAIAIGVLITPYVDKRGIQFKAIGAARIIAIITIVISVVTMIFG